MTVNQRTTAFSFVILSLILSACIPTSSDQTPVPVIPEATPTPQPVATIEPAPTLSVLESHYIPTYYSPFYTQIVEGSRSESDLRVYSILSAENWEPVLRAFQEHYPWINVITFTLEEEEIFKRYYQELEDDALTADILISSDITAWQVLIEQGQVLPYRSQEDSYLPSWAKTGAGIYGFSSDPMIIIYNKTLVKNPPETMQDLSVLASAFPGDFQGRMITYDSGLSAIGFDTNWFWIKNKGEPGWNILNAIGNISPVLATSGTQIVQSVGTGSSSIGYFVSALTVTPRLQEYPNLGWTYVRDGQPISIHNMAITQANASPNSAKLLLDFLLSQEGQLSLSLGGLTPFRADIARISTLHLEKISEEVGQENLIFFSLDPDLRNPQRSQAFLERWSAAVRKNIVPEEIEPEP
jgi:iron(III) transport system substrate-binding protein